MIDRVTLITRTDEKWPVPRFLSVGCIYTNVTYKYKHCVFFVTLVALYYL